MWFLSTQNLAKRCGPMQRLRHVLSQEMHNQMSKFHDMRPSGCGGRFSSHSSIRRIQIDRSRRHRGWGGRFWGERRGTWAHTQCHGIEDLIIYLFIYSQLHLQQCRPRLEQHRQSFSDLISQGIKRVNSAHNLAIPAIVSTLNQGSRSLPPSPQHTPRYALLISIQFSVS